MVQDYLRALALSASLYALLVLSTTLQML